MGCAMFEREQEARKVETSEVEVPALGLPSAAAAQGGVDEGEGEDGMRGV